MDFTRLGDIHQQDLPWKAGSKPRPLTLASFRAGGATWLISQCESSELVRKRGRWVSIQTMEIYTQEVMSLTYMTDIGEEARQSSFCYVTLPGDSSCYVEI